MFIYISLLIITITKITSIEFGKETVFDINHNEFELTFPSSGALFIWVKFNINDALIVQLSFSSLKQSTKVLPPGIGTLIPFQKGNSVKIKLEYKSHGSEKGIIWMNPTTKEIKVDIHQKYEFKYDLKSSFMVKINQKLYFSDKYELIYSIDKAEKDAKLEFIYNDKMEAEDNVLIYNPSKICRGTICNTRITSYDIKKGESYKIYINIVFAKNDHTRLSTSFYSYYMPSYSFSFIYEEEKEEEQKEEEEEQKEEEEEEEKEEEKDDDKNKEKYIDLNDLSNLQIAGIIILTILLIGGIGFCIFLICRKNSKSNLEKNNNKNMAELEIMKDDNIEDDIAEM